MLHVQNCGLCFFSRIKNWHLEGSKKQCCTRVFIACVASVSVRFRSKQRPRNGILGFSRARLVPRSLLQNRTETLATKAAESSRLLLEAKRLWTRDWMGRSIKTWVHENANIYCRFARVITAAMLTVKTSAPGTQKILRKNFLYILLAINLRVTNMAAISFCLQTKNGSRKENVYFL